jgi:putative transposase
MNSWYSAQELAGLPGMPGTERRVRARLENKPSEARKKERGKGLEWPISCLPPETQNALLLASFAGASTGPLRPDGLPVSPAPTFQITSSRVSAAGVLPATERLARPERPERPAGLFIPSLSSLDSPDSGQLDVERARDRILDFIVVYAGSVQAAIDHLNVHHFDGTLPGPLAWAYDHAWSKKRKDSRLNLDTLNKWKAVKKQRGRAAPLKIVKDMSVKPWHALAVALVQRPQGGCKKWVAEQIAAQWQAGWGGKAPSYDVVAKFFRDQFSQIDQLKGRYTGSQLRARMKYQHRDSSNLLPWDEIHADGWNTHFSAPHPVTGEYVTYEVWHAHDVATRFVPPFGVGLTENFEVIAKCVEHAYRAGGCMMFLQTDSTRIVKLSEKFKTNPATAIADRAGFTIVHPVTVGNSQANGIAENFNTWLDKESRELATYQNPRQMDEMSFKRGKRLTAAIVKAQAAGDMALVQAKRNELTRINKGLVLTSHAQTLAWLEDKRQKWNHKPHRALPKVRCAATGKLRHQTPAEALMQHIFAGWEPSLPDLTDAALEQHMVDLFRPHLQIKVRRGTVSPYGGMRYEHDELPHWEGKDVVVAYDIMDWRQVWVKTLKGELICIAQFKEATGYRTLTAQEAADEKRAMARIANKQRAIERDKASVPGMVVEGESRPAILDYIEAEVVPIRVEPQPTLADLLREQPARERERELTFEETCALYMRRSDESDEEQAGSHEDGPAKEAAAG